MFDFHKELENVTSRKANEDKKHKVYFKAKSYCAKIAKDLSIPLAAVTRILMRDVYDADGPNEQMLAFGHNLGIDSNVFCISLTATPTASNVLEFSDKFKRAFDHFYSMYLIDPESVMMMSLANGRLYLLSENGLFIGSNAVTISVMYNEESFLLTEFNSHKIPAFLK